MKPQVEIKNCTVIHRLDRVKRGYLYTPPWKLEIDRLTTRQTSTGQTLRREGLLPLETTGRQIDTLDKEKGYSPLVDR